MKLGKMHSLDISEIKSLVRKGKTLVYFASGTFVNPKYKNLDYENIFLIDYAFRENTFDGKLFCLKLDNIEAVNLFKDIGLKIDFFVSLNEGLFEGGGKYPVNSDVFLGYCFPIFSDKLIHLGCKEYYSGRDFSHLRHHFLDLPFENKTELTSESKDYISPNIFSEMWEGSKIVELKRKTNRIHKILFSNIDVIVKHDSIWSDETSLDAIFTRFDDEYQMHKIQQFNNRVYAIKHKKSNTYKTYDIKAIIELCQKNGYKKIGLVPNGLNYLDQINTFTLRANGYPNEIFYYHLNKGDLNEIYNFKEHRE